MLKENSKNARRSIKSQKKIFLDLKEITRRKVREKLNTNRNIPNSR